MWIYIIRDKDGKDGSLFSSFLEGMYLSVARFNSLVLLLPRISFFGYGKEFGNGALY